MTDSGCPIPGRQIEAVAWLTSRGAGVQTMLRRRRISSEINTNQEHEDSDHENETKNDANQGSAK